MWDGDWPGFRTCFHSLSARYGRQNEAKGLTCNTSSLPYTAAFPMNPIFHMYKPMLPLPTTPLAAHRCGKAARWQPRRAPRASETWPYRCRKRAGLLLGLLQAVRSARRFRKIFQVV